MREDQLTGLGDAGEQRQRHAQYVRNALAIIGQIKTEDRKFAEHLLTAEQALRRAGACLERNPEGRI